MSGKIVLCLLWGLALAGTASADIVGGTVVGEGDWLERSVVALVRKEEAGAVSLCTATLIEENLALTAAHCVENGIEQMRLVFGRNLGRGAIALAPVTRAVIPGRWRSGRAGNLDTGDIALIRFRGPLPPGYLPARLAPSAFKVAVDEEVILAGYGISQARSGTGSGRLRKTHVSVRDGDFGRTEMLLDQSEGTGACHGDSGGPAFAKRDGELYLVGVTSRGFPPNGPDDCRHQVIYTRVAAYRKWLAQQACPEGLSDTQPDCFSRSRRGW